MGWDFRGALEVRPGASSLLNYDGPFAERANNPEKKHGAKTIKESHSIKARATLLVFLRAVIASSLHPSEIMIANLLLLLITVMTCSSCTGALSAAFLFLRLARNKARGSTRSHEP